MHAFCLVQYKLKWVICWVNMLSCFLVWVPYLWTFASIVINNKKLLSLDCFWRLPNCLLNLLSDENLFVAVIMFLISWFFTVVSLALASLIYYYVSLKGKAGDWGDGFKSAYFQLALRSLRSLGGTYIQHYAWEYKLQPALQPLKTKMHGVILIPS